MKTNKNAYHAPQIINQGSAVKMTAAKATGECYDGAPVGGDDTCTCSGQGNSCKAGAD